MAWVRLHDGAFTHPKVTRLSDRAFRLWVWGLCHCQQHLTDGVVVRHVLRGVHHASRKAVAEVVDAGLWESHPGGFIVHDYLDWNDSKEFVVGVRELAKARMVLVRDPEMRQALRDRDQDHCRYCGIKVNWADRKSRSGATYDHVTPGGGDTLENLVIACRGCNSQKQRRTPEQAGMALLPVPDASGCVSKSFNASSALIGSGLGRVGLIEKEERKNGSRAGRLREELYPAWYAQHRHGARLSLIANPLEFQEAERLCATWDDARLEKLAKIVLTTNDDWISKTDRGFKIFALKASWADDRLAAWEKEHGVKA